MPVKIPIHHVDDRAPFLATEPRIVADGVLTVKGAIPGNLHDGYLKRLNLSNGPRTIEAGTFLTEGIPCVSGKTATALAELSMVLDPTGDHIDQSKSEIRVDLVAGPTPVKRETDSISTKVGTIVSDNVIMSCTNRI